MPDAKQSVALGKKRLLNRVLFLSPQTETIRPLKQNDNDEAWAGWLKETDREEAAAHQESQQWPISDLEKMNLDFNIYRSTDRERHEVTSLLTIELGLMTGRVRASE